MKLGLQQRLYNAEARLRRIALGLSQAQLAEKAGITMGVVGAIENLRVLSSEAPSVMKLAAFFDVAPEVLCPPWLKEVAEVPKVVHVEKEVDRQDLPFLPTRRALPAPTADPETPDFGPYDLEWLEVNGRKILSGVEKEMFFTLLGTRKSVKEIAIQFGCSDFTVSKKLKKAQERLAIAWAARKRRGG